MKYEVPIRIIVLGPPAGVTFKVQRGRDELLSPISTNVDSISFEFPITVDTSSGKPNFFGKFAQGPKNERFIYVNSGTLAGQIDSCWSRRAKISLMSITGEQIERVLRSPVGRLEVALHGTGRDGGPVCASLKPPPVWKVVER